MCGSSQRDSRSVPERPSMALLSDKSCVFMKAGDVLQTKGKLPKAKRESCGFGFDYIRNDNVLFLLFASSLFLPTL